LTLTEARALELQPNTQDPEILQRVLDHVKGPVVAEGVGRFEIEPRFGQMMLGVSDYPFQAFAVVEPDSHPEAFDGRVLVEELVVLPSKTGHAN